MKYFYFSTSLESKISELQKKDIFGRLKLWGKYFLDLSLFLYSVTNQFHFYIAGFLDVRPHNLVCK